MHSGGGIISIESAAEFPVRLVESGPAGGPVFAAHIAARYGLDKVLSFDMGGTTAKICLIKNQTPKTSRVFEVARTYRFKKGSGMPISIPVIDMVEIGAGGGSLAHVDAMRQIRVGPERPDQNRAGLLRAWRGTSCGHRCRPGSWAWTPIISPVGSIQLNSIIRVAALQASLGSVLDMDAQTAAYGLSEVVDENMANAARVHAVENGEDLAEYTMIAFGGAAPLHAGRLCEKLGISRLLVPPGAGVGSAIGFLRAPFSFEANRSVYMRLSDFDPQAIRGLLADLEQEAAGFVRGCDANATIQTEFKVYMRYSGQGEEIPVIIPAEQAEAPDAATYQQLFETDYAALFGRIVDGMDIEITVWSANATTLPTPVQPVQQQAQSGTAEASGMRPIFDPALGKAVDSSIVLRAQFDVGFGIPGPAAITEDETTIVLPSSCLAISQPDGCIDILQRS